MTKTLDATDLRLLGWLQQEARLSLSELARRVGLSAPAVAERLRRLEESGVVQNYQARVAPEALGFPIMAILTLTTKPSHYPKVHMVVKRTPEILECYHVTGEASFVIRLVARSITHLQSLVEQLGFYGNTVTSVVMNTVVQKAGLLPTPE